jgi:hypothetical protein
MLGHLVAVEIGERTQRQTVGDAFAKLAMVPALDAHQDERAAPAAR